MEQLKVKTKQYIDKDALIAEIDSILNETNYKPFTDEVLGERKVCKDIKDFINTLEVKEEVLDRNDKTKLMKKCVHKAYKRGYDMGVLLTTNKIKHNTKDVDLEKEAENFVQTGEFVKNESPVLAIAKHFYELGLTQNNE